MNKLWWSSSSGQIELSYTRKQAYSIPLSGAADEAVKDLMKNKNVMFQFSLIPCALIKKILLEYGAWDNEELQDRKTNIERLIWISCLDIQEELYSKGDK
jgi:hypothetical protein